MIEWMAFLVLREKSFRPAVLVRYSSALSGSTRAHRPRFPASPQTHRQLLGEYFRAVQTGELETLVGLLEEQLAPTASETLSTARDLTSGLLRKVL